MKIIYLIVQCIIDQSIHLSCRSKSGKSKKFKSSSSSQDIESDSIKTESKRNKSDCESITPLTEFLDDKAELHAQLFTIISKKEVKEMIPDILKVLELYIHVLVKDINVFFSFLMITSS